jgi:hypothetical protein
LLLADPTNETYLLHEAAQLGAGHPLLLLVLAAAAAAAAAVAAPAVAAPAPALAPKAPPKAAAAALRRRRSVSHLCGVVCVQRRKRRPGVRTITGARSTARAGGGERETGAIEPAAQSFFRCSCS